jgi:hypothetical protein
MIDFHRPRYHLNRSGGTAPLEEEGGKGPTLSRRLMLMPFT